MKIFCFPLGCYQKTPLYKIYTNTSKLSWVTSSEVGEINRGWLNEEMVLHINTLELKAKNILKSFR